MKPTISIALITLGLTFPAPALAVDYVQCEAMKRRFYADTQEQKERADQARRDYWRRTAPPAKPAIDEDCLKDGGSRLMCVNRLDGIWLPKPADPRYAEGMRIYVEVLRQPTEHTKRIVDDMHAAGCF